METTMHAATAKKVRASSIRSTEKKNAAAKEEFDFRGHRIGKGVHLDPLPAKIVGIFFRRTDEDARTFLLWRHAWSFPSLRLPLR